MDSALLKDEKSEKKRKFRKNHHANKKLDKGKKLQCNSKEEKERKQSALKKRKILMLQNRKGSRNMSRLISNTQHAASNIYSEVSTSVSDIECVTKHSSGKDLSLSSKPAKSLKKFKKKIINRNDVLVKNNYNDCIISRNTGGKRKRQHLDTKFSPVKNTKNIKRKKCMSADSPETFEKLKTKKNSLKNKNKDDENDDQKAKTENSNESDSDEDQEIIKELKSSSIYKNIQKLIKDNPSLLSSINCSEDELFESKSEKSLSGSDLEELSIESGDDTSCDDTDKKSEIRQKGLLTPTSNKIKKDKQVSDKGFDRTQKDSFANRDGNVILTGTISSRNFDRTQKDSFATEDGNVASTSMTSCNFDRTQKNSFAYTDGKGISKKVMPNLRDRAREKLQGAKFRFLNEKLYTESGKDSFNYFQKNKDEYMDYHKGYSLQVTKWPLNPVDKIISSLQKMKKNITIADMGCGDAKIARTLSNCSIRSFDLVALNDFVTPCDISKVPLSNESVDVVIFCLSLMGTNLKEYLQEAYRIAKFGGILIIAEVESRIPNLDQFAKSIESLGFSLEKKDVEHKLFVFLEFKKMNKKKKKAKGQDITLKPCLYKKR